MKTKALIVESTRLFQNILTETMADVGVECHVFSSSRKALDATHNDTYTFIIASRTLGDISGEIFLQLFRDQHGFHDALTIMLTASSTDGILLEANKAGYKLVFNKKNLKSLQYFIVKVMNTRTLDLAAKILYIEDSQSIADATLSLFKSSKAKIQHVNCVKDMKQAFTESKFDLVITDYYLKNKETGDDVINFVRRSDDADKSEIPILVVSAESDPKKRTAFLRNGANDFIIKPYDNDELLVRSSNLIASNRLFEQAKLQKQELLKLALTDHLTGLYNRHSLYDIGPKYISNAHRHKSPLSLMVIDLDHFKQVNDTKGHSVGDIVLRTIAAVLSSECRTEDIVARFGGEEFIMLLGNCDLENAIMKSEKLRQKIEECKPENLVITTSIGVAQLAPNEDFGALFDAADKAVYEAKETGRNKVVAAHRK